MKNATIYIGDKDGFCIDIGEITLADNFEFVDTTLLKSITKPHFDFSRRPNSGNNKTDNGWLTSMDGMPPVGLPVEFFNGACWVECKAVCYSKNYVIVEHEGQETPFLQQSANFRPLKSERERAIEEMYALLEEHRLLSYKDICEMLYDAGHRKVVK